MGTYTMYEFFIRAGRAFHMIDTLSYGSLNIFIKRAVPVRKNNFKIFVLPPGQSNRCNLEDLTLQFNQTSQHQTCELDV